MRGDRAPFSVSCCLKGLGERVGTGEDGEGHCPNKGYIEP